MTVETSGAAPVPMPTDPAASGKGGRPRLVVSKPVPKKSESKAQSKSEQVPNRTEMLERLLGFERDLRLVQSVRELRFFLANEVLQVSNARQAFILTTGRGLKGKVAIETVSNLSSIDKNAPALIFLESQFQEAIGAALVRPAGEMAQPHPFQLNLPPRGNGTESSKENAALLLVRDGRGRPFAALILVGSPKGFDAELTVLERIGEAVQHAWCALAPQSGRSVSNRGKKLLAWGGVLLFVMAMFIPVSLTALAPAEIVAKNAEIVAAPIEGVIERILVDENAFVVKGAPLMKYVDTELSANLKIAQQKWAVAAARLQTAQQNSFGTGEGRRDLVTAQAELELAREELTFAEVQFSKTIVTAPRDGTVIVERKSKWQGKPVSVGERVMEIADINSIEARIDLSVADAILIQNDARAQLFLDTNPLKAVEARVTSGSYKALPDDSDQLAFSLYSDVILENERRPRIGARGTAQVYGDKVSLGFYLFRRPLAAVRQWIGW